MAGQVAAALIKGSKKPVKDLLKQADEGDFGEKVVLADKPIEKVEAEIPGSAKEEVKAAQDVQVTDVSEPEAVEVSKETKEVVEKEAETVVKQEAEEEPKVGMGTPLPEDDAGKKVSNISLKNAQTTDDLDALINNTAAANDAFEESRRGVVSNKQTVHESDNYGIEDLLGRKSGEAFNAAQVTSARQILIKSAENLKVAAQKIMDGNATEKDMLEFRQMGASHTAIQYQVSGMTAEAGRAYTSKRSTDETRP